MKKLLLLLGALGALAAATGCSSLPKKLEEFERLGLKEVEITGKFSHTSYQRHEADGVVTSTLEHTNAWIPKARIVRERPAQ